jgi:hypothetical protein
VEGSIEITALYVKVALITNLVDKDCHLKGWISVRIAGCSLSGSSPSFTWTEKMLSSPHIFTTRPASPHRGFIHGHVIRTSPCRGLEPPDGPS